MAGLWLSAELLCAPAFPADGIDFSDWILECASTAGSSKSCQLRQTLRDSAGRRVLQLTVKRSSGAAFLEVITPLSISIPFGVQLLSSAAVNTTPPSQEWSTQVTKPGTKALASGKPDKSTATPSTSAASDQPVPLQLAHCDPDGCRAVATIDEALTARLKSAAGIAIRFQDSKSGKVLTINVSTRGLADGAAMVLAAP